MSTTPKTYVVEHLDPELEAWSALEYETIAKECQQSGSSFILSSVHAKLHNSSKPRFSGNIQMETESVEALFADRKSRICLLDPGAEKELNPEDGETFQLFLFGGILGMASLAMTASC